MLQLIKDYFWVFFVSMLPIVELRGAIPIGVGLGLDIVPTFIVAIIGNILPVPFLILFSKRILTWLATWKHIGPFFQKIIDKAEKQSKKIGKYEFLGLMLFVGIPLPGTGAWTGSLVAALLQVKTKNAILAISLGVIIAGIIMSLASAGLLGIFNAIFSF